MTRTPIASSELQQSVVAAERYSHPDLPVRRKMLVLRSHCGLSRERAGAVAGVSRATVQRYFVAFREGGLGGLRQWDVFSRPSDYTCIN